MSSTVLVTGGSGFLGSWVVREFLKEGWRVRATVRDATQEAKVGHLRRLGEEFAGTLELVEADLLEEGSFEEPAEGASVVVHTASPFSLESGKDPESTLLRPAVEGTRNVLTAARRSSSVQRVVLTSSVVAIHSDARDVADTRHGYFDESYWNEKSSLDYQPYNFSKVEAERAAWAIAKGAPWPLVVLNPGFILGPSLSDRSDATSTRLLLRLLTGEFASGAPPLAYGIVDVRDAGRAHVTAAISEGIEGRHILVGTHASFLEIAHTLDRLSPGAHPLPQREVPKLLLYLLAPKIGISWRYIRRNAGIMPRYDNRKSLEALGIHYRPLEETLRDQREQLIASRLLPG
ncbi:MAG: NAD-dependent epimerase/dehydratase family protein [Alkalispirochaetaceae bacterium]